MATRLHLLKYTRGATMRVPALRARVESWWETERREGAWVREDKDVRRVAERIGLGFDEGYHGDGEGGGGAADGGASVPVGKGKLRAATKMAVRVLMGGFVPSQYWTS